MRRNRRQHLLFAIPQTADVEGRQLEAMPMRDRIRRTRLYAIPAENTAVGIDVVNLGVALRARHPVLGRILSRFDINAIRRTRRRAQKARYALFQPVLVALQNVPPPETLLKLRSLERSRPGRIVLHQGRLEHLPKS